MIWNCTIALIAGGLTWTFLEYCIHRWLGHDRRFRPNFFGEEHVRHHSEGNYFSPAWKKAVMAVVVLAILAGPTLLLGGGIAGILYICGIVFAYLAYEWFHREEHITPGATRIGRYNRRHHYYHHFVDPKMNHGVTSPIWDFVFRTYRRPELIQVPRRLQMVWLADPETGEVRPEHRETYVLRGPAPRQA